MGSLVGGLIGGVTSIIGGRKNEKAANRSADAQIQAAQIAADAAKFRPVGVSTGFGNSYFDFDDDGNLSGAGYNMNPILQDYVTGLMGHAGHGLSMYNDATGMANRMAGRAGDYENLARQAMPTSYDTQQAATDLYNQQRQMLAPQREQELAQLRNQQAQLGRSGLSVGSTNAGYTQGAAGLVGSNPEMAAYYNAMAAQDASLLNGAQQTARGNLQQDINTAMGLNQGALGLWNDGYSLRNSSISPMAALLGLAGNVEGMGQGSLDLGAQLGGRAATAGAAAGQMMQNGMNSAANTRMQGQVGANNAWTGAFSGLGKSVGGMPSIFGNLFGGM